MYGLPPKLDLSFLVGRELFSIHFAMHSVIFHFDNDVSLTVTSSVGCMASDGSIHQYDDFRQAAPMVLALLNQAVLTADGEESGTLTLRFDNGGILAIYDDSKEYESYTINNQGQMIVV